MNKFALVALLLPLFFLSGCVTSPSEPVKVEPNITELVNTSLVTPVQKVLSVHPGNLTIYFFDVGQADSALIITPDNYTLLVDADYGGLALLDKISSLGIKHLNATLATHSHADHIGGMPYIILRFKPELQLDSGIPADSDGYRNYIKFANLTILSADWTMLNSDNVLFEFLTPYSRGGLDADLNENSIVTKVGYGSFHALLMGDCGSVCESKLALEGSADVLKVGHHGSCSATSLEFLSKVSVRDAVISVGANNQYGLPCDGALNNLRVFEVNTYRTDVNGDVVVTTDGVTYGIVKSKM